MGYEKRKMVANWARKASDQAASAIRVPPFSDVTHGAELASAQVTASLRLPLTEAQLDATVRALPFLGSIATMKRVV